MLFLSRNRNGISKVECIKVRTQGVHEDLPAGKIREGRHTEKSMIIDMGPIIYGTLLIYAVGGILCAALLSLCAWALTRGLNRLHRRNPKVKANRPRIGSFSHSPQKGLA
jgi:hypothetical protein